MQRKRKPQSAGVLPGSPNGVLQRVKSASSQGSFALAVVVFLAVSTLSCKPFNVKPRIEVPRAATESQAEASGLLIRASVVQDEDWLNDTFDANLILAGIVPVRVELKNNQQTPVELKKARFELKNASARSFESVSAHRAFKRALSYYELSAWSKALYKESKSDFASYALDLTTALAAGESRQGLMYFLVPGDTARENGFTLVLSRLKGSGPLELKLN